MQSILLFDRVRLPDGREGTVIRGNPDSGHCTISLLGGGHIECLTALLTPINSYTQSKVDHLLRVELDDSLKSISRIHIS